jgi:CheY-like chemotaxis protein
MYRLKNKSISILVVEDNPLDTLIVQTLLQPYFNIETVSDGFDAITIIEEIKFDIILMDINLGNEEMNGVSLMKKIKKTEKHKNIKIIAVTAHSENTELYINEGFDEVYTKPVIKEDIFEYITKHAINNMVTH